MLTMKIDGRSIECPDGKTILEAADSIGIYIPRLCYHPDLPPVDEVTWADSIFQTDTKIIGEKPGIKAGEEGHCNLCLVQVDGLPEPVNSCITPAENGMVIRTNTAEVIERRKQALGKLLTNHPHACMTCAQKKGCSLTDCSSNVPVDERCCVLLGHCELEKVSDYIGIPGDISKYLPKNYPRTKDDPLFARDYNLCVGCLRCVRICQDVRGANILGAVWKDGRAWVGTLNGAGLREAECRFCGACVEVCPTGALLDKENVPVVRKDAPLPCVENCPADIDIPRYLRLITMNRYRDALDLIRSRVPFPGILGYVCFHPCEANCLRGDIDQPVAICALKRFVADEVPIEDVRLPEKQPNTGKKIAVIGSGPTGLTAAYYLSVLGHQIDLFDIADKPGGMLRYGIPDYRLPREILERELEVLSGLGINFRMNHRIGDEFGIPELKSLGFNAILAAAGTPVSKTLSIENSDLDGIYPGLEFLKSAKLLRKPRLDGQIVVIGGGNVAIDAAMTALRLGAQNVQLVCLESRDNMPAHDWEVAQAEEEGVEIHPSWGPKRFISQNGRVSGVELKKCTSVFDKQGRFDPQFKENETYNVSADFIIVAIGQEVDRKLFHRIEGFQYSPDGTLKVDDNFAVDIEGVFAAGDIVQGPSSVVEAIADGRHAAEAIDKYVGGNGIAEIIPGLTGLDNPRLDSSKESIQRSRQTVKTADPEMRKSGFTLIEETYGKQTVRLEAQRCLQCNLRQLITPVILPPEPWQSFDKETVESVPEREGVFQLLDAEKKVIQISGTANLLQDLMKCLGDPGNAKYFIWEEDPMYTKRESELIQQYLQKHGELPGGGIGDDDLDDLF